MGIKLARISVEAITDPPEPSISAAVLTHTITEQIHSVLKTYSDEIRVDNFRLIENGSGFSAAFDMVYPAGLQKREEEIRNSITEKVRSENPKCHPIIKGMIRHERLSLHRS